MLDAATFGCSAICLSLLHLREQPAPPREHRILHELGLGIRHIMAERVLRRIVLTVGVALLVVGFTETLIFAVVAHGLHRPATFIGVLASVQGVGAIPGGLTAAWALRRLGDTRLVGVGLAGVAVGAAGLMAPNLIPIVAAAVLFGFSLPWTIVGFITAIQLRTPPHLQGRAYAAADAFTSTPQTISIALGAALSVVLDYRVLLTVVAVVMGACALSLLGARIPQPVPAAEVEASRGAADG